MGVKHGGPSGRYSIAPNIEEGTGRREIPDPGKSTPGRLKDEQKQTEPSTLLSPPKALPKQTKAKCSLGFCRANQGFNIFGHCLYLIMFALSLVLICVLIYYFPF